ncbi:MAG: DUF1932 domain-containing protein [Alphaproteobacteria bacterium]
MHYPTIAVVSPGDMGHAVGRSLRAGGHRVVTALAGRSARSRAFAAEVGLEDAGDLAGVMATADLVLSIMPPAAALDFARESAAAMGAVGRTPHFADCNAVSPMTVRAIEDVITAAGAAFSDCGIVGPPPGRGGSGFVQGKNQPTRLYVSGPLSETLSDLDGHGVSVRRMGPEIGRASAMKMVYAAINKGTLALLTATLIAAERLGVTDDLMAELDYSQKSTHDRIRAAVGWLATDAGRWTGEMEEIAATFAAAGATPLFHEGARDVYALLATTPLAAEKRETADRTRSLEESLRIFAAAAPPAARSGAA